MKRTFLLITALILLFMITTASHARISDVVLKQKKAVVTIYTQNKEGKVTSSGTGFFIDADGTVVTNYHVISRLLKSDTTLLVKLENGSYVPFHDLLDFDAEKDIALVKVIGNRLPFIRPAKNHQPKQGENIVVIGSPLGLETTISDGIISSVRGKDGLLQITAPISQGSSGSPVLNSDGEVMGVVTYLAKGGQNLNFAVPITYVVGLLAKESLLKKKNNSEGIPAPVPEMTTAAALKHNSTAVLDSSQSTLELADSLFGGGNYKEAEKEYTAAWLKLGRNHQKIPYILLQIARCHLGTGFDMDALSYLLNLESAYPESYENTLGKSIIESKRWFAADNTKHIDFIDAATMKSLNGDTVEASVKRVKSETSYVILDILFDCSRGRFEPIKSIEYLNDMIEAAYEVQYPEWFSVSTNDYAKTFWNVICRKNSLYQ